MAEWNSLFDVLEVMSDLGNAVSEIGDTLPDFVGGWSKPKLNNHYYLSLQNPISHSKVQSVEIVIVRAPLGRLKVSLGDAIIDLPIEAAANQGQRTSPIQPFLAGRALVVILAELIEGLAAAENEMKLKIRATSGIQTRIAQADWCCYRGGPKEDALKICVKPGFYPLESLVTLGTLFGKPICLTVY